jgi:hypothetical protein
MHRWHITPTALVPALTPDPEPVKSALRSSMLAYRGPYWYGFDPADETPSAPTTEAIRIPLYVQRRAHFQHALKLARRRTRDRQRRAAKREAEYSAMRLSTWLRSGR